MRAIRTIMAFALVFSALLTTGDIARADNPILSVGYDPTAFPGMPDPVVLSGFAPDEVYDMAGDGLIFSPAIVTTDPSGTAHTSFIVAGDSTATGMNFTITPQGASSPVAEQWVTVGSPGGAVQTQSPWPMSVDFYGFAAGENVTVSYSSPQITGPASVVAPSTLIGERFDLIGAPGPQQVPFTVTLTGDTYGRTIVLSAILAPDVLTVGMSIDTVDQHDALLATHSRGGVLENVGGFLETTKQISTTSSESFSAGFDVSVAGCSSAPLSMQADGNLVLDCTAGGVTSQLWTSGTAGTGSDNRLVMEPAGYMAIETADGVMVWDSWYGRVWPPELGLGEELIGSDQLWPSPADPYGLGARLTSRGALAVSDGTDSWRSPAAGAGARLVLQKDGNLELVGASGRPVWATRTVRRGVVRLMMESNGDLALLRGNGDAVWTSLGEHLRGRQGFAGTVSIRSSRFRGVDAARGVVRQYTITAQLVPSAHRLVCLQRLSGRWWHVTHACARTNSRGFVDLLGHNFHGYYRLGAAQSRVAAPVHSAQVGFD